MRRAIVAMPLCLLLWGCGTTDDKPVGLDVHQLSDLEKQSLARSLSQKFNQPAQFKWMPVLARHVEESKWMPSFSSSSKKLPPAAYCALVSENGGPYRVFSGTLGQSSANIFDQGTIDSIETSPVGAEGTAHGAVADKCRGLGYSNFSLAQ